MENVLVSGGRRDEREGKSKGEGPNFRFEGDGETSLRGAEEPYFKL